MPTRHIERVSRGRKLTPQEAARYRQLRADIEREKPAINAEIRVQLAEQRELAAVFAELKQVRQALGLSLADIQERTGIDRSGLSKLENGQRANFTLDTVRKYAQAVGKRVLVTVADATEPVAAGR
jgi:DNA-binding XRE family transcriptional regulator